MSDFFAGVSNVRFPEVVMNKGPLPGMGGLPAPLHDTADARINYNSSLLGDLEPYAYGEPGYLSSQNAYLNIPHRIQKIVPELFLPSQDGTTNFRLSHPVDDGDIAFAIRLDRNSEICTGLQNKSVQRAGLGTAIDPLINLCTLNYLLAGIQLCTNVDGLRTKWDQFMHHLDKKYTGDNTQVYDYNDIKHVVKNLIRPFGVAHGSENQGGQHEGTLSSVQWPVNFVISLVLDGKDANVINIWHYHNIEAGDDLVLRLKSVRLPPTYTLNHYGKGLVEKTFNDGIMAQVQASPPQGGQPVTHVWQLVPDIFNLDLEDDQNFPGLPVNFRPQVPPNRIAWQHEGYWHICRTQIHCKKYGYSEYFYNDMANNLRTGHLDVTFQPVHYALPYRHVDFQNAAAVNTTTGPNPRNVFNFMQAQMGINKRPLRLEQAMGLPDASMGMESSMDDSPASKRYRPLSDYLLDNWKVNGGLAEVDMVSVEKAYSPPPERIEKRVTFEAPVVRESGLDEDIGTFESLDDPLPAPHPSTFSVPKPGLKKKPARGRSVLSSILSPDGSVSQEQSRML